MKPSIKIDTREFQKSLREYMAVSRRSLAEVVNQKSFSIALAATKLTHQANKAAIRAELSADGRAGAPKAAAIINYHIKRGGKMGERISKLVGKPIGRGLFGAQMREAERKFISAFSGAAAFMRSGWLPAVAVFARAIGKTPGKSALRAAKKRGIGDAVAAKPGANPTAVLWNAAFAQDANTTKKDGYKHAEKGLQSAMNQEAVRMRQYVERKMQKDADAIARKILR